MQSMNRRKFVRLGAAGLVGVASGRRLLALAQGPSGGPSFELVQPELFAVSGGQPSCWADYDGDGDLDLFVGFKDAVANRLYRNDRGKFIDVADEAVAPVVDEDDEYEEESDEEADEETEEDDDAKDKD